MRNLVRRPRWAFVAVLFLLALGSLRADEFNWPQWRGPSGDGHSAEKGLPLEWDAKAIAWRTPLRGSGQSTRSSGASGSS